MFQIYLTVNLIRIITNVIARSERTKQTMQLGFYIQTYLYLSLLPCLDCRATLAMTGNKKRQPRLPFLFVFLN